MLDVNPGKTLYQRRKEMILAMCEKKILAAFQKYQKDLNHVDGDIKDSIDVMLNKKVLM